MKIFLGEENPMPEKGKAFYEILPVPYDGTSTWKKGADKGPDAILDASETLETYHIDTDSEPINRGVYINGPVLTNQTPEAMFEGVYNKTKEILNRNSFPIILGGEHSVSPGAVKAVQEKYPDVSVLQIDAHSDLRDSYEGSKHNHACAMARISDYVDSIVQVGIRAVSKEELSVLNKERVFFAKDIHGKTDWVKQAVSLLNNHVYLTIDLDGFDPSIMPSTGTPEPGGLLWYQGIELIKELCAQRKLVGFDIVELCPDGNHGSIFTATQLLYNIMAYHGLSI